MHEIFGSSSKNAELEHQILNINLSNIETGASVIFEDDLDVSTEEDIKSQEFLPEESNSTIESQPPEIIQMQNLGRCTSSTDISGQIVIYEAENALQFSSSLTCFQKFCRW